MGSVALRWSEKDRQLLRAARAAYGHSQSACAEALRDLGLSGADQAAVSRWETGGVESPRSAAVSIIRTYYTSAPDIERVLQAGGTLDEDDVAIHEMARSTTGVPYEEPAFGPLQREFLLASLERWRSGTANSEADLEMMREMSRMLRLSGESP